MLGAHIPEPSIYLARCLAIYQQRDAPCEITKGRRQSRDVAWDHHCDFLWLEIHGCSSWKSAGNHEKMVYGSIAFHSYVSWTEGNLQQSWPWQWRLAFVQVFLQHGSSTWLMWLKQCHFYHPWLGMVNILYHLYIYGDFGGWCKWHWFYHIYSFI